MGLQQLGGSRGGSRRPSLQPSILARGRDLWRALAPPPRSATRLCPTRTPARSSRHPYLQSRRDPPKLPQPRRGNRRQQTKGQLDAGARLMNGPFASKRGTASGFPESWAAPGEATSPSRVTVGVSGFSKLPLPARRGTGWGK